MRADQPQMPRTFTFDEFYELLKEYVKDTKAREALAVYDAENAADRGWGHADFSEVAHRALADFSIAGWNILAKHGWPTYREAVEMQKAPEAGEILLKGNEFPRITRRLIRKEPGSPFPDEEIDLYNEERIRKFLSLWMSKYPDNQIYDLPGDE